MFDLDPIEAAREYDDWWHSRARELEDEYESAERRRMAGWIAVAVAVDVMMCAMARYLSWRP